MTMGVLNMHQASALYALHLSRSHLMDCAWSTVVSPMTTLVVWLARQPIIFQARFVNCPTAKRLGRVFARHVARATLSRTTSVHKMMSTVCNTAIMGHVISVQITFMQMLKENASLIKSAVYTQVAIVRVVWVHLLSLTEVATLLIVKTIVKLVAQIAQMVSLYLKEFATRNSLAVCITMEAAQVVQLNSPFQMVNVWLKDAHNTLQTAVQPVVNHTI
jgi:hypothetical protein